VNQITRYRPVAGLVILKVTVPTALFLTASCFIDSRFCLLLTDELPVRSLTSAPGCESNMIVTEEYLTALPMSMSMPEPAFRCPKSGVAYHCEVHAVRRLLSIANLAYRLSSLLGSALTLVSGSKPLAATGLSTVVEVSGVLGPGVGVLEPELCPPPGRSERAAPITASETATRPTATRTPLARRDRRPPTARRPRDRGALLGRPPDCCGRS